MVDPITPLVFVLITTCCVDKLIIVHQNVPTTAWSPDKRAFGTYALGCACFMSLCCVVLCCGATVEETEQDQDENDIEDFVVFSIKSSEGFAILDGGATKTVSGFLSVRPVADQYEDTTIETTDVGFTFAGGETETASLKICIPHAEFPQGISVNVVSNESTPFPIGLDVLCEYGLVLDYHYNRVYSHILKRCLSCALLPTKHLALEMMPSNSEQAQCRVKPSRLDAGTYIQGHKRKERFHLNHSHVIFVKGSHNTSTNTHPQARTTC